MANTTRATRPPPPLSAADGDAPAAADEPTRHTGGTGRSGMTGGSDPSGGSGFSRPSIPAPSTIREGEVLAERYRVHHRLGKGGMGEVYLAEHLTIGRKVAIKTLNAHVKDRPEVAERFLQEARTSSRVRHSNIVDILDFGHTPTGAPFFVMEYLEGEDLKSVLKREKVLPWERTRDIVLQVCAALSAAHAQGLVHRDLKPDNIFLIRQGDQELVKVLDFGIAKSVSTEPGEGITQTGVLLGTPEYMSPEQAHDLPLDGRSDVYALGVLLYRMFTGRLPFRAKSFMTVLAMHMHEAPPPPSTVAPEHPVSPRQEAVILRCLAKKPEDRFQSADAVAAALRALDAGQAFDIDFEVVARPQPPAPRRWLGAAIGAVGLAAAIGMAALMVFRGQDQEDMSQKTVVAAPELEPAAPPVTPPPVEPTQVAPPPVEPPPVTPPIEPTPEEPPDPEDSQPERPVKPGKPGKSGKGDKGAKRGPLAALGDAELRAAAAGLSGALKSCAELGLPGATYKVDVEVNTAGRVTSATAHKPARGSEIGNCVEKAASKASFPALLSAQRATLMLRL